MFEFLFKLLPWNPNSSPLLIKGIIILGSSFLVESKVYFCSFVHSLNFSQKYKSKLQSSFKGKLITSKETYPPCITAILATLKKGVNLDHTSRLVLIFFLLNAEKSVEEIVDLFRAQPDFNEQKTTYYVEHAAGKRGSGTKYSSFGCAKIKSYGLCKEEQDFWCRWHPLHVCNAFQPVSESVFTSASRFFCCTKNR